MAPFAFPSDASVPFVAAIFPEAAMAAADRRNPIHRLDAHHIFRHLVTELALDPEPERRAVRNGQRRAVHVVGENGLRMKGIHERHGLVIFALVVAGLAASDASVSLHSPMPIWQMQRGRGMRRTPGLWPVGNLTGPSSASNRVIPRRMCPPKINLRDACDDRERARKHTARWLWMQSSANLSLLAGFPANREKYREQLHVAGAHPGPMR